MAAPKEIGRKLNGMGECRHGGVRGRKTKVGRKLLRFPPTQFFKNKRVLTHPPPTICKDKR